MINHVKLTNIKAKTVSVMVLNVSPQAEGWAATLTPSPFSKLIYCSILLESDDPDRC